MFLILGGLRRYPAKAHDFIEMEEDRDTALNKAKTFLGSCVDKPLSNRRNEFLDWVQVVDLDNIKIVLDLKLDDDFFGKRRMR